VKLVYVVKGFWVNAEKLEEFEDDLAWHICSLVEKGIVTDTGPTVHVRDEELWKSLHNLLTTLKKFVELQMK